MWLFVVSSSFMFGGFTSYYMYSAASKGKGHGLVLPDVFIYSTVVINSKQCYLVFGIEGAKKSEYCCAAAYSYGLPLFWHCVCLYSVICLVILW